MNKIFFKGGQWFAYEARYEKRGYDIELSKRKASALPVLNPEIIIKRIEKNFPNGVILSEGEEYYWPGTMKKSWLDPDTSSEHIPSKQVYILSLPETTASGDTAKQGEKDFENLKLRVGFTVAHLNDHSKTVAGVLVRQDLKTAADLILELYDKLYKLKRGQ